MIVIIEIDNPKYIKNHVKLDDLTTFLKDYKVRSHVLLVVGSFDVALVSSCIVETLNHN